MNDETLISEFDALADTYSDVYKDVYGVRPRHMALNSATLTLDEMLKIKQNLERELQHLYKELDCEILREEEEQQKAIAAFENTIAVIMETVTGCTRQRAISYIADANGCIDSDGYYDRHELEWILGIPHNYIKV